jgi:6-phosphogluconolactonase
MVARQSVRWHIYPDLAGLVGTAATAILRIAEQAIAERGEFHIALAGGTTPSAIYQRLASAGAEWPRWAIYFGDERCLPVDHPERNSVMAASLWLDRVAIPRNRIFPIPAELGPEEGAAAYRETLAGVGTFDMVLLGLGEDGHTASLFPGQSWGGCAADPAVLPVRSAPKPPPERVSLSAFRLSHARELMVLVTGAAKAPAVAEWRAGRKLPITAIRPAAGVDVMLTPEAWPDAI